MHFSTSNVSLAVLAMINLVAGHGAITGAKGNLGGSGSAIGIEPTTPRDGTGRKPFQQDSTRFRGANKAICGETLLGGANNIETGTAKVLAQKGGQLPQISAGGQLSMTLHQVNGDGAGPYTCSIDSTGTGQNFQPIRVTTQVPGRNGNNGATAKTDLPLNVAIPADQTCTGTVAGQTNVCIVRCENPARAGPFGGCVPVQLAAAAAAPAAGAGAVPAGPGAGVGAGAGPGAGPGAGAGAGRQRGAGAGAGPGVGAGAGPVRPGAAGAGAAARAGQRGPGAEAPNAAAAKFVAADDDDDEDGDDE